MMTYARRMATALGAIGLLVASPIFTACGGAQGGLPAPEDVANPPADAVTTPSGLAWKVLAPGDGMKHPSATDHVTVHYTGWLANGQMFDSSVVRGEPARFPLDQVIAGWTEGVQLMVVGETRRFWIPAELGYGSQGAGYAVPPDASLVFDIELLAIESR